MTTWNQGYNLDHIAELCQLHRNTKFSFLETINIQDLWWLDYTQDLTKRETGAWKRRAHKVRQEINFLNILCETCHQTRPELSKVTFIC